MVMAFILTVVKIAAWWLCFRFYIFPKVCDCFTWISRSSWLVSRHGMSTQDKELKHIDSNSSGNWLKIDFTRRPRPSPRSRPSCPPPCLAPRCSQIRTPEKSMMMIMMTMVMLNTWMVPKMSTWNFQAGKWLIANQSNTVWVFFCRKKEPMQIFRHLSPTLTFFLFL